MAKPDLNLESLELRRAEAYDRKQLWFKAYVDVYRYVLPNRDDRNIWGNYTEDTKERSIMIYDNTAILSAYQRANNMQGLILPQDKVWGSYQVSSLAKKSTAIDPIALFNFNQIINTYINQSDLQTGVSGSFEDLNIGMGTLWITSPSDKQPLSFKSISSLAVCPEFTNENIIETAWIKQVATNRQILLDYPKYSGMKLNEMKAKPNEVSFYWIGEIQIAENKYYTYGVLEDDKLNLLFDETKPYKRMIIYRDRVRPGEVQGRGIAMDLFPTIFTLNTIVKDFTKFLDYKANPPIFYKTDSKFNPFSLQNISGSYIPMGANGVPLQAMETPEFPDVLQAINAYQDVIKTGFQVDPLGDLNSPVRTATEVGVRENIAQRTSATNIARLVEELPKQLFKTCAAILNARGLLPTNISLDNPNLIFNYSSPLLEVQKQANIENLSQASQYIQQYGGEGALLTSFNLKTLLPFIQQNFDLPPGLFNNPQQIAQAIARTKQAAANQAPTPTTSAIQQQPIVAPQTLV